MKTTTISIADNTGTFVWRMFLFLGTLAAAAAIGLLFASFVDLVQNWTVLHLWTPALVD